MDLRIDPRRLKMELAAREMTQADLARRLGYATTTLSGWLHLRHPGPPDLAERIEAEFDLLPGSLASSGEASKVPE